MPICSNLRSTPENEDNPLLISAKPIPAARAAAACPAQRSFRSAAHSALPGREAGANSGNTCELQQSRTQRAGARQSFLAPCPRQAPGGKAPPFKGEQERPEYTKVILAGDRLRKYFPDVSMTPREIEESVYDALEERRQRQLKAQQKEDIFKKNTPKR